MKEATVTVCSACFRASCWQGVHSCDNAARTVDKPVSELAELNREHPNYWVKDLANQELV